MRVASFVNGAPFVAGDTHGVPMGRIVPQKATVVGSTR